MELVYLYIDGYRNFKEAEFNFSQDVELHYDKEKNVLSAEDRVSGIPEGFWGENIRNLSMIVGNNGAGKTSLMQYVILMFQRLWNHVGEVPGMGILVLKEGDEFLYYMEGEWKEKLIKTKSSEQRIFYQLDEEEGSRRRLVRTKLIYLTNVLSAEDYRRNQISSNERYDFLYDASVGGRIFQDRDNDANRKESGHIRYIKKTPIHFSEIETYFAYEQYKQIKFVFDKRQHQTIEKKKYLIPIPEKLYINMMLDHGLDLVMPQGTRKGMEREWTYEKWDEELFSGIECRWKEKWIKLDEAARLKYELKRCAIWSVIRSIIRCFDVGIEKIYLYIYEWIVKDCSKEETFEKIIVKLWDEMERIQKDAASVRGANLQRLIPLRELYLQYLCFIEESGDLTKHFEFEEKSVLGVYLGTRRFSVKTDDLWFLDFFHKYRNICHPDYFLDFSWGLSSGENNLLSMFASLYHIFNVNYRNVEYKIQSSFLPRDGTMELVKCDSVILMIDEADLMYHPEWQRQYISLLTTFLPEIYPPECCKNIQIIISTHSPLLLGDVPQQNVIYLKFDKDKGCMEVVKTPQTGTFGQNIHLLFKDSFFLEQGTIGQFAKKKIEDLFKTMQAIENGERDKEELSECRMTAELIAEPIIRRKLLMKIDAIEAKIMKKEENPWAGLSDEALEKKIQSLLEEKNRRTGL